MYVIRAWYCHNNLVITMSTKYYLTCIPKNNLKIIFIVTYYYCHLQIIYNYVKYILAM